jgi:hypothetical protein
LLLLVISANVHFDAAFAVGRSVVTLAPFGPASLFACVARMQWTSKEKVTCPAGAKAFDVASELQSFKASKLQSFKAKALDPSFRWDDEQRQNPE